MLKDPAAAASGFVDGIVERLDIKRESEGKGESTSAALAGLTFAVKDMFELKGHTAGFGCPDWKDSHEQSKATAPAVEKMLDSGAHLVANTVCDELAFSLDGINIHYGTPFNPRDPERIPGGSSSGPASVVAQGLVDFALGTDTAGSTRVPASYCGIWGLRPTWGAISCDGVLPLGPSFDTVGLLTASLPVLQRVAAVYFPAKAVTLSEAKKLIFAAESFALLDPALAPPLVAAREQLGRHFASVEEREVLEDGLAALVENFNTIRGYEAWQSHSPWYESKSPRLSAAVEKRLLACRAADQGAVKKARQYRARQQEKFAALLGDSILCLPTTAQLPPLKTASDAALEANRSLNMRMCSIASFIGLPQITIPIDQSGVPSARGPAPGLSPGISLVAAAGCEAQLLQLAAAFVN